MEGLHVFFIIVAIIAIILGLAACCRYTECTTTGSGRGFKITRKLHSSCSVENGYDLETGENVGIRPWTIDQMPDAIQEGDDGCGCHNGGHDGVGCDPGGHDGGDCDPRSDDRSDCEYDGGDGGECDIGGDDGSGCDYGEDAGGEGE